MIELTPEQHLINLFDELSQIDDDDYGTEELKGLALDLSSHCRRLKRECERFKHVVEQANAAIELSLCDIQTLTRLFRELLSEVRGTSKPSNSDSPSCTSRSEEPRSQLEAPAPPGLRF